MPENNTITLSLEGRIDSNNAAEVEKSLLASADEHPNADIVLDAEKLQYISSAGLRVLMKLRKRSKKAIPVVNVSSEVYDIFEVTGFTELFDVKKRLREISVEGCEFIGSGGYGHVYRIDPETIVKIYNPGISLEFVQQERDTSQKAFLMGVPTAISYDVVKCGESYGVVYEMLNAQTIAQIISKNPERIPEITGKAAELLKSLHQIVPGQDSGLPNRKQQILELFNELAKYLTESEAEKVRTFINNNIPDRNTFLHGDYNSKNIMVRDGEFQLIDIGDASIGHPVFDILGLMLVYIILPQTTVGNYTEEQKRGLLGFDFKYAPEVWRTMCSTYFGLSTQEEVDAVAKKLMPYCMLLASVHGFRLHGNSPEMCKALVSYFRERTLPLIDTAQPIDF